MWACGFEIGKLMRFGLVSGASSSFVWVLVKEEKQLRKIAGCFVSLCLLIALLFFFPKK